jgi:hypothetical protein
MICTKCGQYKPESEFRKDLRHKNGLQSHCKNCQNEQGKIWRNNNKERKRAMGHAYYKKNQEKIKNRALLQIRKNPEGNRRKVSEWKKKNPGKVAAQIAKREAAEINRTPKWLCQNDFELMETYYDLAHYLTECTDIKWNVDHIIPLQGKNISGLHVPENLRVIPAQENYIKNNRYDITA